MEGDALRRAEALNTYWDDVALGRAPVAPHAIEGETADLVERLRTLGDPPERDSARERVWRDLQQHRRWKEPDMNASAFSADGVVGLPPIPRPGTWAPPRPTVPPPRLWRNPRWAPAQLATALLVLLVLIGSFLAFGPGRPGQHSQEPEAPAIIPAISGTPATPQGVETPVVEFLWQVSKTPDQHFIELGRPAIDPQGNLWVPDARHGQYFIFAPDGTYLETWGTDGGGEGEFNLACETIPYGGVVWDAAGAFYVLDSGNSRIQKFGPDRAFLTSWGSQGTADDQFICPSHLALDQQGRVYVSDRSANKISVFNGEGSWLATWAGLAAPSGIAIDGDGNVWVANYASQEVVKFSADGERLATWKESPSGEPLFVGPNFVAVDAEGRVFVTEHDGNRVQVFAPEGTLLGAWGERGSAPGQFNEPRGLALDGQGGTYVTEWAGNRVQKFQLLPPLAPAP